MCTALWLTWAVFKDTSTVNILYKKIVHVIKISLKTIWQKGSFKKLDRVKECSVLGKVKLSIAETNMFSL